MYVPFHAQLPLRTLLHLLSSDTDPQFHVSKCSTVIVVGVSEWKIRSPLSFVYLMIIGEFNASYNLSSLDMASCCREMPSTIKTFSFPVFPRRKYLNPNNIYDHMLFNAYCLRILWISWKSIQNCIQYNLFIYQLSA